MFGCQFLLMKIKHPVHIMVFGVVTIDSDVKASFIFIYNFKPSAETHIKCLEEIMMTWIERVSAGRSYFWQQDSEPCHTSRRIQSWLSENFCDHIIPNIWPPNLPDCNPWGTFERENIKTPCNAKNELKVKITAAITNLNKDTIRKS